MADTSPGIGGSLLALLAPYYLYVSNGSTLYFENWAWGGAMTWTIAGAEDFAKGFSHDANHFYWVSGSGNAIRRMPHGGPTSAIHSYKSSSTETFYVPVSTGSALYWVDKRTSNGVTFLRRKNLSNGNQVAVSFPFSPPSYMRLLPDALYFPNFDAVTGWSLYRTAR